MIGIGIPFAIVSQDGLCHLKSIEVGFILPKGLVIEAKNDPHPRIQRRMLFKGLSDSFLIADYASFNPLVESWTFTRSAAIVNELCTVPAVHILRCVFVIADNHDSSCIRA